MAADKSFGLGLNCGQTHCLECIKYVALDVEEHSREYEPWKRTLEMKNHTRRTQQVQEREHQRTREHLDVRNRYGTPRIFP